MLPSGRILDILNRKKGTFAVKQSITAGAVLSLYCLFCTGTVTYCNGHLVDTILGELGRGLFKGVRGK